MLPESLISDASVGWSYTTNMIDRHQLNLYNERSLVHEDEERIIYLFDYNESMLPSN